MKFALILLVCLVVISITACAQLKKRDRPALRTVSQVDLNRYLGRWYEIARYDKRFQKSCRGSRATYSRHEDGRISVLNECYEAGTGKKRQARGKAWVVDKNDTAKLRVSFFWPFSGDYWIIDLGKNYEYAVVGHPDRKYLWILSRTKVMDEKLYREILSRLEKQGYDTGKLLREEHNIVGQIL